MLAGASWDATAAAVVAGEADVMVDSVGGVAGVAETRELGVDEGESTASFLEEEAELRATTIKVRTIIPATTAITTRLDDFGLRLAGAGSWVTVAVEMVRGAKLADEGVGVSNAPVSILEDSVDMVARILALGLALFTELRLAGAFLAGAFLAGAFLAGAFLAGAFLAGAFLAGAFLAGAFLAGAFFTGALATTTFFATAFFTGAFFAGAFFAGAFLATDFLLTLFFVAATC